MKEDKMSLAISSLIFLVVVAVFVFISINKKDNMAEVQVAKTGDMVSMNYTGSLPDGTVFDSNVDPQFGHVAPFVFELGAGKVIPGWDKGIEGMKVGEKKTLNIPPEDGYGEYGVPGVIPPNSTLIFEVELVEIVI